MMHNSGDWELLVPDPKKVREEELREEQRHFLQALIVKHRAEKTLKRTRAEVAKEDVANETGGADEE
ncbi:hypothetical protein CMUS01_01487 [Colletotrichum musicola]|uniref:Uncharacterized protein n=1 Tax=Colletotrichum musicola TaxID=2175873 RepID=A0A8H6NX67_9PEZI|nr:hypothetical protein CMUS01_01487 [Colletotrichum musicola]